MGTESDSGQPRGHLRGALLVAAASLLWSSGGLFIKLAPLPGVAAAGTRAAVTAAFLFAVFRPKLSQARWTTAFAYAAMTITFVTATKLTTAANAIFLQYTGPAYVLLLSPWLLREQLQRIDVVSVALSLAGLSLIFVGKVDGGQLAGNLIGVASGLFFGLTILTLRRDAARGGSGSLPSMLLGNLLAVGLTLPFTVGPLGAVLSPLDAGAARALGVFLWLGVVQMGIAYWLFDKGLRSVRAAEASLISMLEPIFSPLWVLLGTGERPSPWTLAGGAVVLAAVALRTVWPARLKRD